MLAIVEDVTPFPLIRFLLAGVDDEEASPPPRGEATPHRHLKDKESSFDDKTFGSVQAKITRSTR